VDSGDTGFYPKILDNLDEGVYFVDRDRRITFWNAGAERITGFPREETVGQLCCESFLRHMHGRAGAMCDDSCALVESMRTGRTIERDLYLRHKRGHRVPVRARVAPMHDAAGRVHGAAQTFSDSSPRIAAQLRIAELEKASLLDPLTGIGNRRYASSVLHARIEEMHRYAAPFGLLFVDVDGFKEVNDRHGHEVGDEVLKMVARDLQVDTRGSDQVFRWGGEEFLVLVLAASGDRLHYVANKLRYLVEQSGFARNGFEVRVTVSVGAAIARDGDTVEALLRRADALMYQSKRAGRNRVTLEPGA